jgi:hypothetical protein
MPIKQKQVEREKTVVWLPALGTPNGIEGVSPTEPTLDAISRADSNLQARKMVIPGDENPTRHRKTLNTVWRAALRRAKVPYFMKDDLQSTSARLSAWGVADECVMQLLRQRDADVFKKRSKMKLQMGRAALQKLNRKRNEERPGLVPERPN